MQEIAYLFGEISTGVRLTRKASVRSAGLLSRIMVGVAEDAREAIVPWERYCIDLKDTDIRMTAHRTNNTPNSLGHGPFNLHV